MALPSLRALSSVHDVVAVLTRAPAPVGRKRVLTPSPVAALAAELGIPVLTPNTLRDPAVIAQLHDLNFDAAAVVAYGKIIPPEALSIGRLGWFNLHFSALPRWRGAAPVQAAIAAGDSSTATTIFRIEAGLDTGDIVDSQSVQIDPEVTAGELLAALAESGAEQLVSALESVAAGTASFTPQQGEASYAPTLTTRDSRINWQEPAAVIAAKIRGYTPEPGAWSMLGKQRIKIEPISFMEAAAIGADSAHYEHLNPGQLLIGKKTVLVGTGSEPIALRMVTPAGKKTMEAIAWARGLHGAEFYFES